MQQAADTIHMYYATWVGRLRHGRASIHLALLLLLCGCRCYRCRRIVFCQLYTRIRFRHFLILPLQVAF